MDIHEKYKPLFSSNCRYFIVTGGRGSGKSFGVNSFSTLLTYESLHKILFTRFTMSSAYDSIIPEFLEKIELLNVKSNFYITKKDIVNKTNESAILFRGVKTSSGDQTANLKSIQGVTTFIIDEAEEFVDEEKFNTINLSIRDKARQNRVIIILNPAYKSHWIYKRFFEDTGVAQDFNGEVGDVCYINTTYLDNLQNLNESFIKEAERVKKSNIEAYNHVFLGHWANNNKGVIFKNWAKPARGATLGAFPEHLPHYIGADWGFSHPFALTKVAINEDTKQIFVQSLVYKAGLTPSQQTKAIVNNVQPETLIIADSAYPHMVQELRNLDYNCIAAHKPAGSVVQGITWMQNYQIMVCDSPDIERELNGYIWADKTSETPIKLNDDAIDSIRYVVYWYRINVLGV